MRELKRRLYAVRDRIVHAWTGGSGPPVLLLHGSPGSSSLVLPLAREFSTRYHVIAPDTPGFGLSEALPSTCLTLADLAEACKDLLDTLGLPCVLVYGTHTGAAIGLELAARHPERVAAFVLEGVPAFTEAEAAPLLSAAYMPEFVPDELGGHFSRTWTRFHDQFVWFPWHRREASALLESDGGSAEAIHQWVEMYYQCAAHYRPAYSAAIAGGAAVRAAAGAITRPGVFVAHPFDMLHPHLARLPQIAGLTRVESIDLTLPAFEARIGALLDELAERVALPRSVAVACQSATRRFIDFEHGALFLRRIGRGRTLRLLLHDAPGGGGRHEAEAARLAERHDATVLLPDLPGCGESAPFPNPDAVKLDDYVDVLAMLLRAEAGTPACVVGRGYGAALGIALRSRYPDLVSTLQCDGLPPRSPVTRASWDARIAPPIQIVEDGAHWYATWLMLRRSLLYRPWYSRLAQDRQSPPTLPDAWELQRWTCEVMRGHRSYGDLVHAVLRDDAWANAAVRPGVLDMAAPAASAVGPQAGHPGPDSPALHR